MNVGIIGSGSWARALATLVAEAGHKPNIGYHKKPLVGFPGSPNIAAVSKESDILFFAVSLPDIRNHIRKAQLGPANRVVIAIRGLEPHTGIWPSDACFLVWSFAQYIVDDSFNENIDWNT